MSKITTIDHAVLTLRIVGNPAAVNLSQAQLEAMPDAEFYNHIDTVASSIGSHSKFEVNEVLRRKIANGWELFQVIPLRTNFNEHQVATATVNEYIFVRYAEDAPTGKSKKTDA